MPTGTNLTEEGSCSTKTWHKLALSKSERSFQIWRVSKIFLPKDIASKGFVSAMSAMLHEYDKTKTEIEPFVITYIKDHDNVLFAATEQYFAEMKEGSEKN